MIASFECVRGEYELCVAYLKFLTSTIARKKADSALLASLLHALVEIFSQYTRWHYRQPQFQHDIGYYCYEAAHVTLSLNTSNSDTKKLLDIVRTALLAGNTGDQLLRTIQTGKERVKSVIHCNGSALLLLRDRRVIMVRKSLSVLNQLLRLKEKDCKIDRTSADKTTAVEQALFSGSASKANMLVILARYVYQTYDSRLAALAGV